jgi:hypothetical protein
MNLTNQTVRAHLAAEFSNFFPAGVDGWQETVRPAVQKLDASARFSLRQPLPDTHTATAPLPICPLGSLPRVCKHAKVWSVVCAKLCVGVLE